MGEGVFWVCLIGVLALVVSNIFYKGWRREQERKQREEELRLRQEQLRLRREELIERFGSEEIADAIIASQIWQGMSQEQLLESWGQPEDVDSKVYKTKTSQTWKYGEIGKNRYSSKVFLENGVIVGWDQR